MNQNQPRRHQRACRFSYAGKASSNKHIIYSRLFFILGQHLLNPLEDSLHGLRSLFIWIIKREVFQIAHTLRQPAALWERDSKQRDLKQITESGYCMALGMMNHYRVYTAFQQFHSILLQVICLSCNNVLNFSVSASAIVIGYARPRMSRVKHG